MQNPMMGYQQPTAPYYGTQNPYQPRPNYNYMTNSNSINWVQGIEGAKGYRLPENSNAILLDSENERFYIKSTDNIGMATLRIFDYVEVTNNANTTPAQQVDMSQYVTRDELEALLKEVKANAKSTISTNERKPLITE